MTNKEIDWSAKIPLVFRISFVKHGHGLQGSFSIRVLFFSFYVGLYYGLGWSANHFLEKWCYRTRIHLKRIYFSFSIGYSELSILDWKTRRLYKRLSPEEKKRFREVLKSV